MMRRLSRNNGWGFPNVGAPVTINFAMDNDKADGRIDTQPAIVILMSSPYSDSEFIGSQYAHD